MRRPGGYAIAVDPDEGTAEYDTITCGHCQQVVFVKPGTGCTEYLTQDVRGFFTGETEPGAFCRLCMHAICLRCHDGGGCTPWERRMERIESRDRMIHAILG